jgi:hypothetical protein
MKSGHDKHRARHATPHLSRRITQRMENYEKAQPRLGDSFEVEVRRGLEQIAAVPESAPIYLGEFRRLLVRRFEHGIFYRVHGS